MLRLLALLGGLSTATDLGSGAPLEESVKRAVVAVRVARRMGLDDETVREVLYTALLEHLGCTAYSHELAGLFGDDLGAIRAAFIADQSRPADLLATSVTMVSAASGRSRGRTLAAMLAHGRKVGRAAPVSTCEVARDAARRLALPEGVERGLAHVTAQWDGQGFPQVGGTDIPLSTRIMHVASVAALFCLRDGPAAALRAVRGRAGTELDPEVAAVLSHEEMGDLVELDGREALLDCEPDPVRRVDQPELERVAELFGNLADLKSPWLHGHSAAVASVSGDAAGRLGLPDVSTIRVAGHLHDVGRMGVSSRIWDKQGHLSTAERAQVELHPWHTEQVLGSAPELATVATIARSHHERLDGSGYHRHAVAAQLSQPARVLAAADRYTTLREDRPHRRALAEAAAAERLRREATDGLLDPDVVAAVLADPSHSRRRARPAGLTDRQVTVLRLIASGRSNREIAAELVISGRTAEHHVQDVYARIGVSSRAAAALFAMEHGLLAESG